MFENIDGKVFDDLCGYYIRRIHEYQASLDEATRRAGHAEEALAKVAANCEFYKGLHENQAATIEKYQGALDEMEERAKNAEYNARHYWRELVAEQNKSRMYKQERDFERRRVDELNRAPNLWATTDGNDWKLVRAGGIENGSGIVFTSKVVTNSAIGG